MFFSGQGPVFFAPNDINGVLGSLLDIGNLESFNFGFEPNVITDKESKSGNRLVAARIETELTANVSITLKEPNVENLEIMFRAARVTNVGASVTNETNFKASGIAVGDIVVSKFQNISSLVVTDSAGSPATLTLGTHYEILSAKFGRVRFLNVTGHTQPYKFAYTYANRVITPLFNDVQKDYFIHMEGINTVDSTNFLAQFYKARVSPPTEFNLLQDEFGRFTLEGELLIDPTRDLDANFRQFGRLANPI